MAGTRRQFRARVTTNDRLRQRSTSQVSAIVPETAIAAPPSAVEIAESADEASPHSTNSPQPGTPSNLSTRAFCKNCNGNLGEFYNSWHKGTGSYYSPALLGSYRSLLQRREASYLTELAGCNIDLTCCPNCSTYLGFVIVDSPADGKRPYGQEYFKLQLIELRCETSEGKTITVDPLENVATDLIALEDSPSSFLASIRPGTATMELDTPLSSSHPLWGQPAHREHRRQSQSLSRESIHQPTQSQTPRSAAAAATSNDERPSHTMPSPKSPQPAQLHSGNVTGTPAPTSHSMPTVNSLKNRYSYPRDLPEVHFDAIERLQTQTSQNTSALAAQARTQIESAEIVRQIESSLRNEFQAQLQRQDQELRMMSDLVNRLSRDLQDCHRNVVALVQEVFVDKAESTRRSSVAVQPGYQDEALELMAQRIGDVSHRTADLETMREHVAILSGKVQRLESESNTTNTTHQHTAHASHQSIYQPTHPAPVAHPAPPHAAQASHFHTPRPASVSQTVQHHDQPAAAIPPESAQRHEPLPAHNGWATVNAGVKRVFDNGTDSPHRAASPTSGDSKRPRLSSENSRDMPAVAQHPPEPPQILASQTQPVVASQQLTQPVPHPGAHPIPPPLQQYPYSTQGSPTEHRWHADPLYTSDVRPARGRGSRGGRGPGSRGGRVRKSMQGHQHRVGTPEIEHSWGTVSDSRGSPSSFEDHSAQPGKSVVRRGGGGGGGARGGALMRERSGEWTPDIGPRSVFHDRDSPIEVKKTRSKPIRNEDGILVRKDGRPDRRSQSSAANLRKVHARKEEQQREAEAGLTPTGLQASMSAGPDTPSPMTRSHPEPNMTDSVRKKHNAILGRIFPDGLDDSRKQHDYAHQVFNEDHDHTAHPRTQVSRTAKAISHTKKESVERIEVAETQAPTDADMEMVDAGISINGYADGNRQRPAGEATGTPQQDIVKTTGEDVSSGQDNTVQVPETQATGGSASFAVESVEAA